MEFVNALCPEIWNVDAGRLTHIGKKALVEDAFADGGSAQTSAAPSAIPSRIGSRAGSKASSTNASPAGSDDESSVKTKTPKKKKKTRNEIKAQEVRRAQRKLKWLNYGGEREPDTESDSEILKT
jgi:elongation factor 3